ncbi:MAG: hypothetical protein ACR2KE_10225 [Candidatus Nanopelagicales bacterium]
MASRLIAGMCAAVLAAAALVVAVPAEAAAPAGKVTCQTPPKGTNADETGKKLAVKFFRLMKNDDVSGLEVFLSPAFQAQSGDGTGKNYDTFFSTPLPQVKTFAVSKVRAVLSLFLLTVRYLVRATGNVGGHPYAIDAAPRLSTFSFCSGEWQLVSHGNFDPLRK